MTVAGLSGGGCASMWSRIFWIMSGSIIRRRPCPMTRMVPPHNGHTEISSRSRPVQRLVWAVRRRDAEPRLEVRLIQLPIQLLLSICIHFDRLLNWFFYVLWERWVSSLGHLADGSPELILRNTVLGYAGVCAPEQQVCLENPGVKTKHVWSRPKAASTKQEQNRVTDQQNRVTDQNMQISLAKEI